MSTDRSTHPNVVEYAVQTMIKRGKSPSAAAKDTVKKHHGTENMFFGSGPTSIDASTLENALWNRMVESTIRNMSNIKVGMEHYALDGTLQHFNQKPGIRAELKRRVIEKMGRDPFTNDDTPSLKEAPMTRKNDAESAGEQYALDQIESDYFMDWAREQLLEASQMSPGEVLPLETKADALVIAKNMLQQLEWDTKHGLDNRDLASVLGVDDVTRDDHTAFYSGFRKALDSSRDWLADSLLEIERGMRGGGVEETSSARTRHVPSKRLTRSTAKPGMHVRVVDGDSMYRGEVGTIVEPDVRRLNKLDDFNRRFLKGEGAVLVERRNGSLFTIHARALERENENPIDRRRLTAGARRSLKPRRYSDEQVRAMLAQVPMYREQLLTAAKERGWDRPSVVPITEVHAFLRAQLAASGVSEARRGRAQPLVDTKLYSVTWTGGRQGNLTDREAVDLVRQLRNDWVETGRSGLLNIQVWYRDGSLVPYADLERRLDVLHRI